MAVGGIVLAGLGWQPRRIRRCGFPQGVADAGNAIAGDAEYLYTLVVRVYSSNGWCHREGCEALCGLLGTMEGYEVS